MSEHEARFLHLLKPIKDMADNWNVDLAEELKDYLEDLDKIHIAFKDGDLNLNFAEAALLIQGSASVYSKKVECLYSLVYQTLDLLSNSNTNSNLKKRRESTDDLSDELFLLLDSEITVGARINLETRVNDPRSTLREKIPFALLGGRAGNFESGGAFKMLTSSVDSIGAFVMGRQPSVEAATLLDDQEMDGYESPSQHMEHDDYGESHEDTNFGAEHEEEEVSRVEWEMLDPHEPPQNYTPLVKGKTWSVPSVLNSDATALKIHSRKSISYTNLLSSMVYFPDQVGKKFKSDQVMYPEFKSYLKHVRATVKCVSKLSARKESVVEEEDEEEYFSSTEDAENKQDDFYYNGDDDFNHDDEIPESTTFQLNESHIEPPNSYLSMVKDHLQSYLANAQKWASESRLHMVVREWEEKIEPILEIQNNRPVFDIHDYGEQILTELKEETETSFEELAASYSNTNGESSSLDQFEVCRLFLASLQLANTGNVELKHSSNNSQLKVKYVDNIQANERLENFLAPSVKEKSFDEVGGKVKRSNKLRKVSA